MVLTLVQMMNMKMMTHLVSKNLPMRRMMQTAKKKILMLQLQLMLPGLHPMQ